MARAPHGFDISRAVEIAVFSLFLFLLKVEPPDLEEITAQR